MHFEYEFVAHRKINFFNLAIVKIHGSKSRVIDFGSVEVAVVELAIYESNANQIAIRKITIGKSTGFKFFEIEGFQTVVEVVVVLVKEILGHF